MITISILIFEALTADETGMEEEMESGGGPGTVEVVAANEEPVEGVNVQYSTTANDISPEDGVKNPREVHNDAITKTARYYFQPKYS